MRCKPCIRPGTDRAAVELVGGLLPAEQRGELEEGEGHRGGVRGPAAPAPARGGLRLSQKKKKTAQLTTT